MKLAPAQGLALALAAQQPEPLGAQENAGVRGVGAQAFGMRLFLAGSDAGRYACQGGRSQRESGYPAKIHSPRLCHSDTAPAHAATAGGKVHSETLRNFSMIQSIDSWRSGCYFR